MVCETNNVTVVVCVECYRMKTQFPLHSYHKIIHICLLAIVPIIALFICILNVVAIKVFSSKKFLKIPANVYILNTSIADLISGGILIPIVVFHHSYILLHHEQFCIIYAIMVFFSHLTHWLSFLFVFAMGVQRFTTIFRPFNRSELLHTHRKVIASIWFISLAIVVSSFFVEQYVISKLAALFIVPVIVACSFFIHLRIAWLTKKLQKEIFNRQQYTMELNDKHNSKTSSPALLPVTTTTTTTPPPPPPTTTTPTPTTPPPPSPPPPPLPPTPPTTTTSPPPTTTVKTPRHFTSDFKKTFSKKEHKVNRLTFLMLTSLSLSYVPYCCVTIIWVVGNKSSMLYTLFKIAQMLMQLKCLVNPILYFYHLTSARREVHSSITNYISRSVKS